MNPTIREDEALEPLEPPEEDAPSGSAAAVDSAEGVHDQVREAISAGVATMLDAFRDKLAYDRFKEEQIDRLHDELQEHKKDLLARALRPLIHGLIRLHDDLGRTTEALAAKPSEELTPERFFKTLEGFCDDLVLLLEGNGVHPFEAPGEDFDPQTQTAVRRVESAEPERVGRIAERLRPGFAQSATLLQKERVAVYVAAPRVEEPEEPAADSQDVSPPSES